ncbi:hypothetical protein PHYSODRAFT_511548, partial [Phytophthora sojae]
LPLAQARRNSRSLYRRILRESRQLEPNTRELYRRFARSVQVTNESFRSDCRLHETPDGYIQDVSASEVFTGLKFGTKGCFTLALARCMMQCTSAAIYIAQEARHSLAFDCTLSVNCTTRNWDIIEMG